MGRLCILLTVGAWVELSFTMGSGLSDIPPKERGGGGGAGRMERNALALGGDSVGGVFLLTRGRDGAVSFFSMMALLTTRVSLFTLLPSFDTTHT
jgi:hypothetical protein